MRNILLLLAIPFMVVSTAFGQYEDMVKTKLNDVLKEKIVNISPPKGCECNTCKFNYAEAMKIERTRKVEGKLLVWGKAKVDYKSTFEGAGTKVVTFYAELTKGNGQVFVTKLKWQSDACMRLADLM